ncbi:MAG: precorrin-6y C5,15-methyltransferase (decarboxylating) subunit CbiE [Magnetococcales bacterium]|nr:precorrin-6y C5,15-methyltransferase (decarboxylating) subunit CbiE [Magnetococcales bacterium]
MSWVIGVTDDGPDRLVPAAARQIGEADLVVGDGRFLHQYGPLMKEGVEAREIKGRIRAVPGWLEEAAALGRKAVVLATGDPMFHGIGGYLARHLPPDQLRVLGTISTLQAAFERLMLPWDGALRISIHRRDDGDWEDESGPDHVLYPLWLALGEADLIGLLTSPDNGPDRIARMIVSTGLAARFTLTVCERMGSGEERIIHALAPEEAANRTFVSPNVVVLMRTEIVNELALKNLPVFGIPDRCFQENISRKGLMTKREARAVTLAVLALRPTDVVWDIGAGSGSIGLEAARLIPGGRVFAIEKDPGRVREIRRNQAVLDVYNYRIDAGRAAVGIHDWPDPDAVFMGGSGGELAELICEVSQRLRPGGRLVMNFIALENLAIAMASLSQCHFSWDVIQLQAARSKPILDMNRLSADTPLWILTAQRKEENPADPSSDQLPDEIGS